MVTVDTVCPYVNMGLPKRHIRSTRNMLTGNYIRASDPLQLVLPDPSTPSSWNVMTNSEITWSRCRS